MSKTKLVQIDFERAADEMVKGNSKNVFVDFGHSIHEIGVVTDRSLEKWMGCNYLIRVETPCNDKSVAAKDKIFELIRQWAKDKGIDKADPDKQLRKLAEEFGEVASAMTDGSELELMSEVGDMVVVLTNLAMIYGVDIEDCIRAAYDKIVDRKGNMVDGIFVRDKDRDDG